MPAMPIDPAKARLVIEHKHDAPLMSCVFDPRGRFLFSGGRGPGVMCIEIATGEKTTLTGHDSWVGEMARAGSDLVLTGDYLGRVIAWDCSAEPPRERWNIDAHPSTIRALAVSADGETFATGDRDGIVRIWQTSDGRQLHELPKNVHPIYGLAFHPDGQRIVSADRQPQKPQIKVWDIATGVLAKKSGSTRNISRATSPDASSPHACSASDEASTIPLGLVREVRTISSLTPVSRRS